MSLLDLFRKRSETPKVLTETDLELIRAEMRTLRLEWVEAHEKIIHALDRLRKREKQLVDEKPPENTDNMADLWALARQRGLV